MVALPKQPINLAPSIKDKYILIVDDQQVIRKMIKNFLVQLGVPHRQILDADDGDTALKIVEERKGAIGFILLDWNMPRVPGIMVLSRVKADPVTARIPVLMVTAETDETQILYAAEAGVNGYLMKPFAANDLGEKMLNILTPPAYIKRMTEAENLIEDGRCDEALKILGEILILKPDSAGVRMLMGMAHKGKGDREEAKKLYRLAVESNPRYLKAMMSLAHFLVEDNDLDEALDILDRADKISPDMPGRKIVMGKVHLKRGDAEQAEASFHKATALNPDLSSEIAAYCLENENATLATEFLNQSVAARKRYGAMTPAEIDEFIGRYNKAGIQFRKSGQWRRSISAYKNALEVDPTNVALHFNIGKAYLQGGDPREGRDWLERCLALNREAAEPDERVAQAIDQLLKGG